MTSPGEEGRSNLCDAGVNSPSESDLSEVRNFPELPVVPSTDFTRKEGRSRSAASVVNFHNIGAFNGVELPQWNPLDKSEANSNEELQRSGNPSEETELKQRCENPELSASNAQGSLPSKVELIPRPIRDRKMPAKFDEYEVKFVRAMIAKRLHSDGISPQSGIRSDRIIWNSNFSETKPESVYTNAEGLTLYVWILRQNRIQIDQSATRVDSQSEAEPGPLQQSPITPPRAAHSARVFSARTHTQYPSTESALLAVEYYKRQCTAQLDTNTDRENIASDYASDDGLEFETESLRNLEEGVEGVEIIEDDENSDGDGSNMARTKNTERKSRDGFKCHVCGKVYRQHFGRKWHLGVQHRVNELNNPFAPTARVAHYVAPHSTPKGLTNLLKLSFIIIILLNNLGNPCCCYCLP